ncbi:MBL fold metallo-hydrolase [Flexivirga caeni]|uniref:MBL fold metallo-hydrolase n=1 Tax=Flexivirga caeni TaxID=2294115 RepID=A0A3M9LX77_9MICO|nr:MBL fold metallo-hydrolase [Flexivirga caeni]RNI17894.1 MBL fold metallo-hydrolase [Flexivirga caeni]
MQLTHLGHSCLLIEVAGQRVLIDPGTFSSFDEVAELDAILVTHQHPDHLDPDRFEALRERNPRAAVHADPQSAEMLRAREVPATETVAGRTFAFGDLEITPAGVHHAVITEYVPRIANVGLYLSAPGEPSVFHPGDALDAEVPGDVDLLAVPVNAPWCAVKETVAFVRRIEPTAVLPIHDALVTEAGRGLYLQHIRDFGRAGGIPVRDIRGAGAVAV